MKIGTVANSYTNSPTNIYNSSISGAFVHEGRQECQICKTKHWVLVKTSPIQWRVCNLWFSGNYILGSYNICIIQLHSVNLRTCVLPLVRTGNTFCEIVNGGSPDSGWRAVHPYKLSVCNINTPSTEATIANKAKLIQQYPTFWPPNPASPTPIVRTEMPNAQSFFFAIILCKFLMMDLYAWHAEVYQILIFVENILNNSEVWRKHFHVYLCKHLRNRICAIMICWNVLLTIHLV